MRQDTSASLRESLAHDEAVEGPPIQRSLVGMHVYDTPLTKREMEIAQLLMSTLSTMEIGSQLYLSVHTIRTHTKSIYHKLGVNRREDFRLVYPNSVCKPGYDVSDKSGLGPPLMKVLEDAQAGMESVNAETIYAMLMSVIDEAGCDLATQLLVRNVLEAVATPEVIALHFQGLFVCRVIFFRGEGPLRRLHVLKAADLAAAYEQVRSRLSDGADVELSAALAERHDALLGLLADHELAQRMLTHRP